MERLKLAVKMTVADNGRERRINSAIVLPLASRGKGSAGEVEIRVTLNRYGHFPELSKIV